MSADVPWVGDEAARDEDERRLSAFVGRRVVRTRYLEVDYAGLGITPEPTWSGDGFDALDFGLELDLDDGATWSFVWLQAGDNEGLLAYEGTLVSTRLRPGGSRVWPVGETSGWGSVIERPVVRVDGAWVVCAADVQGRPADRCVVTWVLHFGDERAVVITLGDADGDGSYRYSCDSVAVFFSLDAARGAGVPLPGDPDVV